MYFHSRQQAGRMLASRLVEKYRYENCAVVALDDGGVIIGAEIAKQLHCALNITISREIDLPNEPLAVGGLAPDGQLVYNSEYSAGDIDELQEENRAYIEEQRIAKFHEINELVNNAGVVDRHVLAGHNVILTSDGLGSSFKLDVALTFIKPIKYEKVIVASPLASVGVVDWMHVHADEIYCLSVVESFADTSHYYDIQDVPDQGTIPKILNANILNWQ